MASSLTIAPSLGRSTVAAQGMAGGYDAIDFRSFWGVALQEGAVGAGDFMVTERGAGANLTVDVACSTGNVVVQGDTVTGQGLYVVRPHTAVANLDIATAHGTNPRVDSVVVQVDDDEHDAGGNTRARVMVLTGTATGGATLDNRTGAPALPASALLLADVLVPATDTTISNTQIRDRRKWARGAQFSILRHQGSNYTTTGVSPARIDSTNLEFRVECSGVPIVVELQASGFHSVANTGIQISLAIDAAEGTNLKRRSSGTGASAAGAPLYARWELTSLAVGSHLFAPMYCGEAAGTTTILNSGSYALEFTITELVRQNQRNNSVTSG